MDCTGLGVGLECGSNLLGSSRDAEWAGSAQQEKESLKGKKKRLRTEMIPHGSCSVGRILREWDNIPAEGCLGAGNVPEGVG